MLTASELQCQRSGLICTLAGEVANSWKSLLHLMSNSGGDAKQTAGANEKAEIQACLSGDHEAYEQIVRRYQQQVANLLWRFTRNRTEHEDLVHIVFVEAYISLPKFRGEGAFGAWLSTIATRVGYAFWKQQGKNRDRNVVSLERAEEPAVDETSSNSDDDFERLELALQQLSPRDRLVITLLHLEENSVAEVAKLTGWSQSMVKVQAHRARAKLKKLLESYDHE